MSSEYYFSEKEWSALPYNFKDKKLGYDDTFAMMDRFPDLKTMPEFTRPIQPTGLDKNAVIAYIILFYSPTTPLSKIPDIIDRKKTAAIEAGMVVDPETHRLPADCEEVLYCKNKHVNGMIIAYLRKFKNTKWALLCTGNESFYLKLKMILDITNDSDSKTDQEIEKIRGDLFKQAETMEASLSRIVSEFLSDDSPYLRGDLFSFMEEKSDVVLMLSPELRNAARSIAAV